MSFTPEEITEILQIYFDNFVNQKYTGMRYVPIFGRRGEASIDWDNSEPYEPLTIVIYNNESYTSRQFVPAGAAITDTDYWAKTGAYNAQIIALQDALPIAQFDSENTVKDYIDELGSFLPTSDFDNDNTVKAYIDGFADLLPSSAFDSVNTVRGFVNQSIDNLKVVTPEMFDAVGDGSTDDTTALNAAINFAADNNAVLRLVSTYAFETPITINKRITIERVEDCGLKYTGSTSTGYALTFDGLQLCNISIALTQTPDFYGIAGLRIKNCLRNVFDVIVSGFSVGLYVVGDNYDCDYNTIYPTHIKNNLVNIELGAINTNGAVNQNMFIGGSIRIDSDQVSNIHAGDYITNLKLKSDTTHTANNNTFVGVSFECVTECHIDINGNTNAFINCRYEGITDISVIGYENIFIGGFGLENITNKSFALGTLLLSRNIPTMPIEKDALILQDNGSTAANYLEMKNSTRTIAYCFDKQAGLKINYGTAGVNLNCFAHTLPTFIKAADSVPAYSTGHYGSIFLDASGTGAGKRALLRENDGWRNILYSHSAASASRPTSGIYNGYMMFDTTLGKPIWYYNNGWVDATGTSV